MHFHINFWIVLNDKGIREISLPFHTDVFEIRNIQALHVDFDFPWRYVFHLICHFFRRNSKSFRVKFHITIFIY
jgi:hypothetical protein